MNLDNPKNQGVEADIIDYWKTIMNKRRLILLIIFLSIIVAVVAILCIKKIYKGELTVKLTLPTIKDTTYCTSYVRKTGLSDILPFTGNIPSNSRDEIFAANSNVFKNVRILPETTDQFRIIVEAEQMDNVKRTYDILLNYINEAAKTKAIFEEAVKEIDICLKTTSRALKENDEMLKNLFPDNRGHSSESKLGRPLYFVISEDTIRQRHAAQFNSQRDIIYLQQLAKKSETMRVLLPIDYHVMKIPSISTTIKIFFFSSLAGLFIGIFLAFYWEYIEKIRQKKTGQT